MISKKETLVQAVINKNEELKCFIEKTYKGLPQLEEFNFYRNSLSKINIPKLNICTENFGWIGYDLFFRLLIASVCCSYEFELDDSAENIRVKLTVESEGVSIDRYLDGLASFQVERIVFSFIEEQLHIEKLSNESENDFLIHELEVEYNIDKFVARVAMIKSKLKLNQLISNNS
jgi:hypothetical protein